jgi:hypothetical protein
MRHDGRTFTSWKALPMRQPTPFGLARIGPPIKPRRGRQGALGLPALLQPAKTRRRIFNRYWKAERNPLVHHPNKNLAKRYSFKISRRNRPARNFHPGLSDTEYCTPRAVTGPVRPPPGTLDRSPEAAQTNSFLLATAPALEAPPYPPESKLRLSTPSAAAFSPIASSRGCRSHPSVPHLCRAAAARDC